MRRLLMKTWSVLRWVYQALLAVLHKLYDMILTGTFYLIADTERLWIGVNPETVSLDANNVQAAPLQVRFWAGEGSNKVAMSAYLTFRVESVVGSSVTKLFEDKPVSKVSSYDYTIPSDQYATANRISIYAYEDAARTKEIDSKQVNIVAANPTPFPRSDDWNVENVYKNGEYLKQDNVLYMWTSRVPGNTEISPKEWIEAHQESGLWTPYPYDKLIAAEIALLNFALIGSAVFQDEYMISQQGVDASGNPTNDFRKFGTEEFTPNLLLNFAIGLFKGNNVEVNGGVFKNIRSPNNSFKIKENGDIEIVGRIETSFNGKRVVIDPETNSIKMYNQSEQEVLTMSFMDSEWNGEITSIPRLRMQRIMSSGVVTALADVSPGSIALRAKGIDVFYDMTISPLSGITFIRDGVVTKSYPAS
nr:MAG TPA: hypothetical protein [Bacteriophage sp.]